MTSSILNQYDTVIVGGGLVGAALAAGVARNGVQVAVLDGADTDFRASRGNFGLVWVQGKGAEFAPYARLSGLAASRWPALAKELRETTGVDVGLQQSGGYDFCLDQKEWDARAAEMRAVLEHTGGEFEYEMLDRDELGKRLPQVSPRVLGASYSPLDGHANPLYLLRALQQRMQQLGGDYHANEAVLSTRPRGDGFEIATERGRYRCRRVVFCAGLGNQKLAADLDMYVPVQPLRGQILITERVEKFLPCATLQVRQTLEGTLQIGDSHEDVGYDDAATVDVIRRLAARAVAIFPHLASVRLQRAWGALRVMTPDGLPVYHQSPVYPGAYAVSCHSGVTLAAWHAGEIADWICGGEQHALIGDFTAERFDVQAA